MARPRRSTGSAVTPREMSRYRDQARRAAGQAEDMAAVDRGENIRVILLGGFRGDYGKFRRLFAGVLYLEPRIPVLHWLWWRFPVTDQILSARVRPFKSSWEKARKENSGEFNLEKRVIIECVTEGGILEFGVGKTDADLVLHYLNKLAAAGFPPGRALP